MNLFESLKNLFQKRKVKKLEQKIQTNDEYVDKAMSIDNIELASMFEKKIPSKMLSLLKKIRRNIYNDKLSTQITDDKLKQIIRDFFAGIDSEFSDRVNSILDGKDSRFILKIDESFNGRNFVTAPNVYPTEICITRCNDLRDVYALVHELTHCLDIDNGDTPTRRILGEVASQCMERLLDTYLIENCNSLGFDPKTLSTDIELRKITTFISRAKNAMAFNEAQRNHRYNEVDSRYILAQLYQTELMKNPTKVAKRKLSSFIRCVRDDDFEGANNVIGVDLRKDNKLQRENLIVETISEAEKSIYKFELLSAYEKLLSQINEKLTRNEDTKFSYMLGGVLYDIVVMAPKDGINIPSVVFIPKGKNVSNTIVLESNNMESLDNTDILEQTSETGIRLANIFKGKPCPIVVPMLPSLPSGVPYFQQLSRECFELLDTDKYYRIDEQIVRILETVKEKLSTEYGMNCNDKIFLNGYSSSGVFAQRFSLIHPELIETACIGGASR